MNSRTLREAARAALPEGAFLRRDRGEALFVTDAPRVAPGANWPSVLARAGFLAAERGGLLCLTPGSAWLTRLEDACPAPPDALCRGLFRFAGREIEAESLALFAAGARVLDGDRPQPNGHVHGRGQEPREITDCVQEPDRFGHSANWRELCRQQRQQLYVEH